VFKEIVLYLKKESLYLRMELEMKSNTPFFEFCLTRYNQDLEAWIDECKSLNINKNINQGFQLPRDPPGTYEFKCLCELPCDMRKFKKEVKKDGKFNIWMFNRNKRSSFGDSTYHFQIKIKDNLVDEIYDNYNTVEKVLIELLRIIRSIPDCHYIEETINTVDKYTGIRTYGPRRDLL
jgi:hypothetical protein